MKLKKDSTTQKLRGAYYTPLQLADAMVGLFSYKEIKTVLEPSCGDGVFLDSLSQLGVLDQIDSLSAVEIEFSAATKVKDAYWSKKQIHVFNEDFFNFYDRVHGQKQYDLILGNPPYIRYQYLSEEQRDMLSKVLKAHGMKANKLINTWVAFLVACVQLLSSRGKIAFVIPAEILQVAYAEELRLFLADHMAKITLITFEQLVFPEVEQEVVIFIGEKGEVQKGIRIIEMNDLNDFRDFNLQQNGFQKIHHIKEKWTQYFISADEMELIQQIKNDSRFSKFSDYGLINVGITTGNNGFFSVTEDICKRYNLENVSLPLIGRSSHSHGIMFTEDDWKRNKKEGKRARLVSFPENIPFDDYPSGHKEYILLGEKQGDNKGYKCTIRDRWYTVPSVWIPDAFFLRRNNLYPKFVLNNCNAVSTDTMHRMKFFSGVKPDIILLSYYNSITFAFTEICGRSYGGGVLEILPGEMGNIVLPIINSIDCQEKCELLQQIDSVVRANKDIEAALDIVDKCVLINLLGIDPAWCTKCRAIWKKMQKRRLGRG